MNKKCSTTTSKGTPCKNWAIHDSDPPLCASHSGRTGAPKGNTNAVTHGFYQKIIREEEVEEIFDQAQNVTLIHEAILIRVLIKRLMNYLALENTPPEKITTVAPLVFTGARALTFLEKNLPDSNTLDWDAALDMINEEFGWDV